MGVSSKVALLLALAMGLWSCQPSAPELPLGAEQIGDDESSIAEKMITAIKRHSSAQRNNPVMMRFNQVKTHACLHGVFLVGKDIAPELQQGIFSPGARYPVTARFASAKNWDDREKDFRGLSLKLSATPGEALWGESGVTDFVLNSYQQLFAATPEHFLSFVEATADDQLWRYFINPRHWYSLPIVLNGRSRNNSVLEINYYSTTAYRLGRETQQAVKYAVSPCGSRPVMGFDGRDRDFLSANIGRHLDQQAACFRFGIQPQTNAKSMPIENAAARWSQRDSPFQQVATITFSSQQLFGEDSVASCENLTFNPWQVSADHQPLGGINRVRKAVYSEIGRFRTDHNHAQATKQKR